MTPIVISLPGTPRGKGRPRFDGVRKRTFTDDKTVAYENALRWAGKAAMTGREPMEGPLAVTMIAEFPIAPSWPKRKQAAALAGELKPTVTPDWDNIGKTVDALNGIVWKDDAQITDGRILKRYGNHPGITITVSAA